MNLLTCTTPDCDRAPYARGLCQRCYQYRWRHRELPPRARELSGPRTRYPTTDVLCSHPACTRLVWRDGRCYGHRYLVVVGIVPAATGGVGRRVK